MHLSITCLCKIRLWYMKDFRKKTCIELRPASMMCAPSPHALLPHALGPHAPQCASRLLKLSLVVILMANSFFNWSNLFLQNLLCEMWKTFENFCIEMCLASMMRVPLPRALHFGTLRALVHLTPFKTKLSTKFLVLSCSHNLAQDSNYTTFSKSGAEILPGQGFVLRNPTIPFLPSTPPNGQREQITRSPTILHSSSPSHHNMFGWWRLNPTNHCQGKRWMPTTWSPTTMGKEMVHCFFLLKAHKTPNRIVRIPSFKHILYGDLSINSCCYVVIFPFLAA